MINGITLDDSVQDAIKNIKINLKFDKNTDVKVSEGSASGDGYASKTCAVQLKSNEKKLDLFVKYFPIDTIQQKEVIIKLFNNETRFYDQIYPIFEKFQLYKNVKAPFNNVPKYFNPGETRGLKPIVLENLKVEGFDLRNRQELIDEEHLCLALKAFGKLHATGFALKDQDFETFLKITDGVKDVLADTIVESGFDKVIGSCITQFIESLDPKEDKDILRASNGLQESVVDFIRNIPEFQGRYCTFLQGDCWSNNMMFLYKGSNKPLGIKLIDWQIIRVNYPVFDLSYFFYSAATSKMLGNWENYMGIYHKYFSEHCRNLGSDPNELYPFEVLKEHWRKYSKYGLGMAFLLVKAMLYDKDEAPDLAKSLEGDKIDANIFNNKTRHQDVYDRKMKDIFRHFIVNKFI
ncbi:uncharacterized protein [Onthophagus taurus]|uniref:uncharacterized protein n=1 Tax=Onthophagus taurus TaxID=166361 RepID=UPI0039BDF426